MKEGRRAGPLFTAAAVSFLALSFSSPAHAGFIIDEFFEGNSWSATLGYSVAGAFLAWETAEAFIVADGGAGPFESPGLGNWSVPGWADGTVVNPGYAIATGPGGWSSASFTVFFDGDINQALTLDFFGWVGPVGAGPPMAVAAQFVHNPGGGLSLVCQVGSAAIDTNNNCTTWDALNPNYDRSPAVPEPAVLGMFGLGLAGLRLVRRRRPA